MLTFLTASKQLHQLPWPLATVTIPAHKDNTYITENALQRLWPSSINYRQTTVILCWPCLQLDIYGTMTSCLQSLGYHNFTRHLILTEFTERAFINKQETLTNPYSIRIQSFKLNHIAVVNCICKKIYWPKVLSYTCYWSIITDGIMRRLLHCYSRTMQDESIWILKNSSKYNWNTKKYYWNRRKCLW